jgi:hypothetical protein
VKDVVEPVSVVYVGVVGERIAHPPVVVADPDGRSARVADGSDELEGSRARESPVAAQCHGALEFGACLVGTAR